MQTPPSLASRLGHGRAVVLHVDDLAMCHGANAGFFDLAAHGLVTCGSVMVPCPWFREIVETAASEPKLDFGVHLTLTSEWEGYRWAPISTTSRASGLIDGDGYFPRDLARLRSSLVPEAAEAELRAQIERALAAGLRPTHIDAHMAAAMLPELLELHVRLGRDYGVFPVLPRAVRFAPDAEAYARTVAALDAAGLPVVDAFRGTIPATGGELAERWRDRIASLPLGVTHVALHATAPGEIEAIAPRHAAWRTGEYALLRSGAVARWCEEAGVAAVGYRELQELWIEACGPSTRGQRPEKGDERNPHHEHEDR